MTMVEDVHWALSQHVGGLRLATSIPGTAAVAGAVASGAELAGSVGGLIGGVAAIAGLFLAIAASNARRRREYEAELREAEERGEDRFRSDMEFWRGIAVSLLQSHGGAVPIPPSQRPHRRRAAGGVPDDA